MPEQIPPDGSSRPVTRVTLRDVANALGISHVAVSLALRNSSEVSATRREQVQAMAAKMGYRPNALGAGLAEYRRNAKNPPVTSVIAWINHWPEPARLRTFREHQLYWEGALQAAEHQGYRLEEFVCGPSLPLRRLEQVLIARNVRGLLLPPLFGGSQFESANFKWDEFSVVRFGYSLRQLHVHMVGSNHFANTRTALQHMRELGYRRIGYVTHKEVNTFFLPGLLFEQISWPVSNRLPPLILEEADQAGRKATFLRWLRKTKPDAILSEIGQVRTWLEQAGYALPGDMGLAALSVLDGGTDSGIDQRPWHIGKAAAEVAISRINNNDFGLSEVCREILIEGRWVEGSTLRHV